MNEKTMKEAKALFDVIDGISDQYLVEAIRYKKRWPAVRILTVAAACIVLCIAAALAGSRAGTIPVNVYAYGSDQIIGWQKPTLMEGTISDSGEMHGTPLEFYVTGRNIEKIRYSVRNQYISFMDCTGKREDYGTSKSFTIEYGDEADYYYLVIEWEPVSTIRALTDHPDIGITNLPEEDRKDIIVMQITYENGREETCAININLTDDGKFQAEVVPYEISDKDTFVLNPDTVNVPAYSSGETTENDREEEQGTGNEAESGNTESSSIRSNFSDEELQEITAAARRYYASLSYDVTDITPDYDETVAEQSDYDDYGPDEILVLRVTFKDDEIPRYITIGSKDGWKNCTVLNEGY